MKTSELTGAALDWAVWACEKPNDEFLQQRRKCRPYSTDWAQGGPIIEREWINLQCINDSLWEADISDGIGTYIEYLKNGPTPLVAAMRCYVAAKLGDDVDVPEELCQPTA